MLDESKVADEKNRQKVEDEEPVLLDPCDPEDPELLDFNERGATVLRSDLSPLERKRVEYSVERLKLDDHTPLIRGRKRVWGECMRTINNYERLALRNDRQWAKVELSHIRRMMEKDRPYSAVAIACVRKKGIGPLKKMIPPTI